MTHPVVTLLSDFGTDDWYVAAMKLLVRRTCPQATLIDVTHSIAPGDILAGSIALEAMFALREPGAVHLAVVDPGVGGERKPLVVRLLEQWFVGPDNGLITWAWRRHGPGEAFEITWRPPTLCNTFHGRDLFAPIAGMLAAGKGLERITRPLPAPILLEVAPTAGPEGQVIHIDHFGNATTSVLGDGLPPGTPVSVNGRLIRTMRTYSDAAPGEALALVGSSGMLEIAVREGSAALSLGLHRGVPVRVKPPGAGDAASSPAHQ